MNRRKFAKLPSEVSDKFRYPYDPRADNLKTALRIVTPISYFGVGFGASGATSFQTPGLIMTAWIVGIVSLITPMVIWMFAKKYETREKELDDHYEKIIKERVIESLNVYKIENFDHRNLRMSFRRQGEHKELYFVSYSEWLNGNYKGHLSFGPQGDDILLFPRHKDQIMPTTTATAET